MLKPMRLHSWHRASRMVKHCPQTFMAKHKSDSSEWKQLVIIFTAPEGEMQATATTSRLGLPSRSTIPMPADGLGGRDTDWAGSVSESLALGPTVYHHHSLRRRPGDRQGLLARDTHRPGGRSFRSIQHFNSETSFSSSP